MLIFTYIAVGLIVKVVAGIPHPIQLAENQTKCRYSKLPTGYLFVGKTVSVPGECVQITCNRDLTISGLTCPTYYTLPGCNITHFNYYKEYPQCCPEINCIYGEYRLHSKRQTAGTSVSINNLPCKFLMLALMLFLLF